VTWQSWITLAIATLGAILGLYNSWNAYQVRKVRLRVIPKWSIGDGFSGMGIEVINLSAFLITIYEVGLTIGKSRGPLPKRLPIPIGNVVQGGNLPVRLDRREVYSIIYSVDGLAKYDIRKAYALTASGEIALGSSGALRQFIKIRRPI
jgi:hypothetical protein